jgi:uncharacterized membrane protein YesL
MGNFFSIDNPIMSGILKVMNCILICLLWIICCLPIVTIGTATTALYYTIQKVIKNDRGYAASEFFKSFRSNFKKTILIWLLMLLAAVIFIGDILILKMYAQAGYLWANVYFLFEFALALELIYSIYVFSYCARFTNTTKAILKNSAILAIRHFGTTMKIIVILGASFVIVFILPVSFFIIPIVAIWLISIPLEKLYFKYMDEADKQAEQERNMEYYK